MDQTLTRRRALALAGIGGAALVVPRRALADGDPIEAPPPLPFRPPPPGTVGILPRQLARLSIVHHTHPAFVPAPPCNIVGSLYGEDGKLLTEGKFADLGAHEAVFLDLPHPGKGAGLDSRLALSAHVRFTPGHLIGATLEVIDAATGHTEFAVGPCGLADPGLGQPADGMEPAFPVPGTIGMAPGQRVRLSIVHHGTPERVPAPPCNIVGSLYGEDGKLLTEGKFADLGAHEAVFLDLPHPGKGAGLDSRLALSAHVRFTPGHLIGATLEVIDAATGHTEFAVGPCGLADPTL